MEIKILNPSGERERERKYGTKNSQPIRRGRKREKRWRYKFSTHQEREKKREKMEIAVLNPI